MGGLRGSLNIRFAQFSDGVSSLICGRTMFLDCVG